MAVTPQDGLVWPPLSPAKKKVLRSELGGGRYAFVYVNSSVMTSQCNYVPNKIIFSVTTNTLSPEYLIMNQGLSIPKSI